VNVQGNLPEEEIKKMIDSQSQEDTFIDDPFVLSYLNDNTVEIDYWVNGI